MSRLHDGAGVHGYEFTVTAIERSFGQPLTALFTEFNPVPVASGSVAQVYLATLRGGTPWYADPRPRRVAVKVRHPNVAKEISEDFRILNGLANRTHRWEVMKGLSLKSSVAQFSHTMTAQTDLRVEALHLARARDQCARDAAFVTIPEPIWPLVTAEVLVESFEEGETVARYIKRPGMLNTKIVARGVDAFMKVIINTHKKNTYKTC